MDGELCSGLVGQHLDTVAEVVRLLDASPWTMHPDYGCVLAADVEDLDRQDMAEPAG